jgi:hypothetical protein
MSELEQVGDIIKRLPIIHGLKNWILSNMTIVCDTREKENGHIIGAINKRVTRVTSPENAIKTRINTISMW